jgi:serine/threonine-protein kinase
MKHVREPLPDVQKLRPEISAALAAVIEHATAKETANRYATADHMVHDLEQVLAIEAARSGEAPGEATTVLRSLPGDTAEVAPIRLRRPRRALLLSALVIGLVGGLIAYFATRTERGPGGGDVPGQGRLTPVQVTSGAADDYDPLGDQEEHEEQVQNVLDDNPSTVWDTEEYQGELADHKEGVGIYIDAGAPVAGRAMRVESSTPGFEATVYAAKASVPPSIDNRGWTDLSGSTTVGTEETIRLDTARSEFRYYLLWITSLPEGSKAAIKRIVLLR